ncbi:MAG TPA: ATP-binding protein [Polyangiaceae bacterium]|nr:ATP-binding protein [Polyangiaceae bacterium]
MTETEEARSVFRLGVRAKLFLISLGLILLTAGIGWAYVQRSVDTALTREVQHELFHRARLAAAHIESTPGADSASTQRLVGQLAALAAGRVTVIAKDGTVLGDSGVSDTQLSQVENHANRPEVIAALSTGRGAHTRLSGTVGMRMTYVAVPFERDGVVQGVVRVAVPLTHVDEVLTRVKGVLGGATLLALVVAILLSSIAAHWASRTARSLTVTAERMAQGDLAARTGVTGHDEFASLGRALDQLASNLSQTVDALETQHETTRGILEGMHEGVLLLGPDGRVGLVNPALREMLLLTGDATGKTPLEIIRHAELKTLLDRVAVEQESLSTEFGLGGLKPRQLLVRAAPFTRGTGGVFAVFVDVTEMRRLESLRSDFVANVSHELRTPVTTVRSAAETLSSALDHDPKAALKFLEIIERNASRLQDLVEDLLDLSRIESRQYQMQFEAVRLSTLYARVVELFQQRIAERNIKAVLELDDPEAVVRADRRALEHVLTNLVDNAVKYAGQAAELRLGALPLGDGFEIFVADNGPGIAPSHLPRLFERFYRVDAGRSRELGGTGLGLAIVKHLVEAMGSTIQVQSEVGAGTRFSFQLSGWHDDDQPLDSSLSKKSGLMTGKVGRPSSTTS